MRIAEIQARLAEINTLIDNATGEVLAIVNSDSHDDYASSEMALMMAGFLAKKMWGIE